MPTAMDVAQYFLAALGTDAESDITNLKLQKLCAYAQAFSLAFLGEPLFREPLEAWTHGPVVPPLYEAFKKNGSNPIPPTEGLSENFAREPFTDKQKFVLDWIKNRYGSLSAWTLRERSHLDFPGEFGSRRTIPVEQIAEAFSQHAAIRKLKEYRPPEHEGLPLSEEEFWNAVSA